MGTGQLLRPASAASTASGRVNICRPAHEPTPPLALNAGNGRFANGKMLPSGPTRFRKAEIRVLPKLLNFRGMLAEKWCEPIFHSHVDGREK